MTLLPGSWRKWINRSSSGPFLNAESLNDLELKLRALDCLGAFRAISLVDALPGSPADGDAYLTSATATPANKIVRRFDGNWEAFTPIAGMVAFLSDGSAKQFTSGAWAAAPFSSGLALPSITLSGDVDADNINGGLPCVVEFTGVTSWSHFPAEFDGGSSRCAMLQLVGGSAGNGPLATQIIFSTRWGGMYHRERVTYPVGGGAWNPWTGIWDEGLLPVSTYMKTVLDDANADAARATLGAAPIVGAEVLIHSDFGRSATTDVWQSAFANNAASGLQFAANTIANGTKLIIEQALSIPGDGGGATYQVYIGPQLTGEQSPSGSTYAIAIAPNIAGQNGTGTLRIEIELLGSGSSITGYVTSVFSASGSNAPWVNTGTISVDGTQANSLDVRFNPDAETSYVIHRNRVRRVNP